MLPIPELLTDGPSLTSLALESTMPAFSVTETAGPWDGPAYWLNALLRSLTRPIKRDRRSCLTGRFVAHKS